MMGLHSVDMSADFEVRVNGEDLHRKIWTFEVDGLVHQVVSYI